MTIHIEINTDNAAFDGLNQPVEVARILKRVVKDFEGEDRRFEVDDTMTLFDVNGNKVGRVYATN